MACLWRNQQLVEVRLSKLCGIPNSSPSNITILRAQPARRAMTESSLAFTNGVCSCVSWYCDEHLLHSVTPWSFKSIFMDGLARGSIWATGENGADAHGGVGDLVVYHSLSRDLFCHVYSGRCNNGMWETYKRLLAVSAEVIKSRRSFNTV